MSIESLPKGQKSYMFSRGQKVFYAETLKLEVYFQKTPERDLRVLP